MSGKSSKSHDEELSQCLPVKVNTKKHPPPELPPLPKDLTSLQVRVLLHVVQGDRRVEHFVISKLFDKIL